MPVHGAVVLRQRVCPQPEMRRRARAGVAPASRQMRAAREWLKVERFVLSGGHGPNISRPEALAKLLDEIAA